MVRINIFAAQDAPKVPDGFMIHPPISSSLMLRNSVKPNISYHTIANDCTLIVITLSCVMLSPSNLNRKWLLSSGV